MQLVVSQAASSPNSRLFFAANNVYYVSAGINIWGSNIRLVDGQGCTFMNMGFKQTWLISGMTDVVFQNFNVGMEHFASSPTAYSATRCVIQYLISEASTLCPIRLEALASAALYQFKPYPVASHASPLSISTPFAPR